MNHIENKTYELRLVAWEVTRRCHLKCLHCRGASRDQDYSGELSTEEGLKLIDSIASLAKPILIFTGGVPMMRQDIFQLARHASDKGLYVVMAPCGQLITPEAARKIKKSGIRRISISFDGATAESHDRFRGVPGAFGSAMKGLKNAIAEGIEFQVNTTITRTNLAELDGIYDLALKLNAAALDIFMLVPTGRGSALKNQSLTAEEYQEVLEKICKLQKTSPISVKCTCAPQFARIKSQEPGKNEKHGGGGCIGGRGFVFVSYKGILQPCGFLDVEAGDLRKENFDFGRIYLSSKVFMSLRNVDGYHGRCGICEFRRSCGGCRARAHANDGDMLGEDAICGYVPRKSQPQRHRGTKSD